MKAARINGRQAPAMDEQSVERAIEMLEQMVASCARMVASLESDRDRARSSNRSCSDRTIAPPTNPDAPVMKRVRRICVAG